MFISLFADNASFIIDTKAIVNCSMFSGDEQGCFVMQLPFVACVQVGLSNGNLINMLFMDLKSAAGEFESLARYLDLQQ